MHINLQEIQASQERNQLPPDIVGGSTFKDLIKTIAEALVDQPEQLSVAEVGGDHISVLKLRVGKTDIGKVIGKGGRNANAIRTILSSVSAKNKRRALLEIEE